MNNIFLISTPLHLFEAFLIHKESDRNIFIIDERLRDQYHVNDFLKGRLLFCKFDDRYLKMLVKSCMLRYGRIKNKRSKLYISNQDHAISSYLVNKYDINQIHVMDDGLVNYGLQSESVNFTKLMIKKIAINFFNLFGVKILNVGPGNNLYFKGFDDIYFYGFSSTYIKRGVKINYKAIEKYLDIEKKRKIEEIKNKYYKYIADRFLFLSFKQSMSLGSDSGRKYIKHPAFSNKGDRPPIPYEFLIGGRYVQSGLSSILLVKKFVYQETDFNLVDHHLDERRKDSLAKLIGG